MKYFVIFANFILVFILLYGCEQKPVVTPSGTKIKLGIIASLSGSQKNKGKEGLVGIKTAMKLHPFLNNGDRIELVIEDEKSNPTDSVKALKKLSQEDKVTAILAFSNSETALELARIAHRYKTPILIVITTNPDIVKNNAWVSQLSYDDDFQGTVAALYVRDELLFEKVAVFSQPENPYSSHLASIFVREFVSVGGRITDSIYVSQEDNDYSKILAIIHKHKPELIYLPVESKHVLTISRSVKALNWKPILMGGDGLLSNVLTKYTKELDLLEGALASSLYSYDISLTEYGIQAKKAFNSMDHKYEANSYSVMGLEAFTLMTDVMNRCNNPSDRKCVNAMIRSTHNLTGVMGKISIDTKGKAQRPLFINRIHNGKAKFVVKVN
jgi:branched-chain amino acid transport system substrate-binding protein